VQNRRNVDPLRRLTGQLGAEVKWSRYNSKDGTERAREAGPNGDAYFEKLVDPDEVLPADERARRVEHARRAHFLRMALLSAKARRAKKAAQA
jgi:hypothetical protein